MIKIIKQLLDHFLSKHRWRKYCSTYTNEDDMLMANMESALAVYHLFATADLKDVPYSKCKSYYIRPLIGSLYDLLYFISECSYQMEHNKRLALKVFDETEESIRLDVWIRQPMDSAWVDVDLRKAVLLIGHHLELIDRWKGDIPLSYIERRLSRVIECYLMLVEILGDENYGSS